MAKKITIDIEVNGKMQKATVSAKKLRSALDDADQGYQNTSKSSRTYDRNAKGAAKTTSNTTKEFSKMAQGMGGLVGAYATVAASVFALSAAFNFFKQAADLAALTTGQELFAQRTGVSMKLMTSNIQDATGGLVAFKEAAQAAAIGEAAGLTADQMERLGKVAKNAGTILGRDVTDSFNRLTRGAIKAEPELLDELGIIIRIDRASQDYAATINKNANDLTQFEKTQAVVNAVLEQGSQKFQDVGDNVNQVAKFGAAFQDTFKKLSEPVAEVANFVAGALQDSILAVSAVIGILGLNIVKALAPAGPAFKNTAEEGVAARKRIMEAVQQGTEKGMAADIRAGKFTEANLAAVERAHRIKSNTVVNLSMSERAAIERDVAIIRAQNLRMTMEGQRGFAKMITAWKLQLAVFVAEYGKAMGTIKAATAAASMVMSRLLSALSIAGLIVMFVELGKQARRAFLITPELRAAEEALDKITEAVKEQKAAIKEVRDQLEPATSELNAFGKAFGLVTNFNLGPVRGQINLLRESIEQLKSDTIKFDPSKTFEDITPTQGGLGLAESTLFKTGLFDKNTIPKNLGELNTALTESAQRLKIAEANFDEMTEGMSKSDKFFERVKAHFGELGKAQKQFNDIQLAASSMGLGTTLVKNMEGADVAEAALKGVTPALELLENQLNAMKDTGINVEGFNKDGLDDLKSKLEAAQVAFEGMDPALFEDALNVLLKDLDVFSASAQTAIDRSNRAKAAFKGIADSVSAFGEGTQEFMPQSSQFEGLLSSLKETGNNFKTLRTEIDGFDDKKLSEVASTEMSDTESQAFIRTLNLVNKLRGEGNELSFETVKIGELVEATEQERLKLLESQIILEHQLAEEKIRQQRALLTQPAINRSLLNSLGKRNEAQIALNKAQETYTLEVEKLKVADENRKRFLQNQVDAAQASLNLAERERKEQEALLPILVEQQQNRLKSKELNILKEQNSLLEKQRQMRAEIVGLLTDQIEKDNELAIQEAALRNPFFDEERASTEARVLIEKALLETRRADIQKQFENKMREIDIEYKLLEAKNKASVLELKASAAKLKASDNADDRALADQYEELANLQEGLFPQFQAAREAAEELATVTKETSLANLDRVVRGAEIAEEKLHPIRQVLGDAAGAFRTGLEDSINAVFTSLHDKSMDLGDTLKSIGMGLLQTIQEAITKKMIVDPLLDALNLGEEDPTEKLKDELDKGSQKIQAATEAGGTTAATDMKDGIVDGGRDVKNKMEQGGRNAATEIRSALRDIELKIKVQCCEQGPEGPLTADGIGKAVASAVTAGTDTTGTPTAVAGFTPTVNADDPLIKQQLLSMQNSLMPQQQPGTEFLNQNYGQMGIDAAQPTVVKLADETMQSLGAVPGGLSSIFGEDTQQAPSAPQAIGGGAIGASSMGTADENAEALKENTGMLDNLGNITIGQISEIGLLIGGLAGNSKIGQVMSQTMAALQLATLLQRLFTGKNTLAQTTLSGVITGGLIPAILANTAAQAVPGKTGIYPPLGYAMGGIAKGPRSGYPAVLHGNEAVVPLPDGKTIPVDLGDAKVQGGGGQQNNVTVNVSMDNNGSRKDSETADGENAAALGAAISVAVQKELQNQKRPGGILSPHGVA